MQHYLHYIYCIQPSKWLRAYLYIYLYILPTSYFSLFLVRHIFYLCHLTWHRTSPAAATSALVSQLTARRASIYVADRVATNFYVYSTYVVVVYYSSSSSSSSTSSSVYTYPPPPIKLNSTDVVTIQWVFILGTCTITSTDNEYPQEEEDLNLVSFLVQFILCFQQMWINQCHNHYL